MLITFLKGVKEYLKGVQIFLLINIIFQFYQVPYSFIQFPVLIGKPKIINRGSFDRRLFRDVGSGHEKCHQ